MIFHTPLASRLPTRKDGHSVYLSRREFINKATLKMSGVIQTKRRLTNDPLEDQILTRVTPKEINTNISNTRENLFYNITNLYGEEFYRETKKFEKSKSKRAKLLCDLAFLSRCRDKKVVPVCFQVNRQEKRHSVSQILTKTSFALIRNEIKYIRFKLDTLSKEILQSHIKLANTLHPLLWNQLDNLIEFRTENNKQINTNRHINKFNRLQNKIKKLTPQQTLDSNKLIHNLTDLQLNPDMISILSKGFNFGVVPPKIPNEDIITGIESAICKLNDNIAETIRQESCHILRKSHPPKSNITKNEARALKELRTNTEIVILPADKGNATVIMKSEDYHAKMNNILKDPAYKLHSNNPITYLEKTTKSKIASSELNEDLKKSLIPREKSSRFPKLYGLPKIHKKEIPLRPIVSSIGSPLQSLSKYLAKCLQPAVEKADSFVKNSEHFVKIIESQKLDKNDILVSFDIVSLFTNIPINEALNTVREICQPPEDIINLIEHCLNNTFFLFDSKTFKQIKGAPMGSSLSPPIANLFMTKFEKDALENYSLKPKLWKRYVDDTFVIWPHGLNELNKFLSYLNGLHEDIKFTMEIENNSKIPFLDVLVLKKDNGDLGHTVYRKATHTDRYLHASSNHHPAQIASVANTLISRAIKISDSDHRKEEINHLKNTLQCNGFSKQIVNKAFKRQSDIKNRNLTDSITEEPLSTAFLPYIKGTTDKISRLLRKYKVRTVFRTENKISSLLRSVKDKIHLESHGVYEIPCGSCDKTYVGKSNRKISARVAEHRVDMTNKKLTSSLVQHTLEEGHKIDFDNSRVIANIENETVRTFREAIEIYKRKNILNNRDDGIRLPSAWKNILFTSRFNNKNNNIINQNKPLDTTSVPVNIDTKTKRITRSQTNAIKAKNTHCKIPRNH